jgi:hypothetical protein
VFGRTKKPAAGVAAGDPKVAAMHRAIEAQRATDPLIGAKIGGKAVFDQMLERLKDERGVQVELVATVLGALAGRACFLAAVLGAQQGDPQYAGKSIMTVTGKDGGEYLFGDAVNWPMLESPHSVWALIAGILQQQGAAIPDRGALAQWNADRIGTPEYGIPEYEPGTGVASTPREYLVLWQVAQASVTQGTTRPTEWPIAYGLAAQHLLQMVAGQFDPTVIARIVLQSAIATSKLMLPVEQGDLAIAGR